jgi:haloalkane dehalogenase
MKRVKVLDSEMAYVDAGEGPPVVFLHGNPTSSHTWRHAIAELSGNVRCLAPDLIGMGLSSASPRAGYRFVEQSAYLDAWFDAMGLQGAIFVLQDWGVPLGLYRARRNPHEMAALAYMEGLVLPRRWSDLPPGREPAFRALRGAQGERMVLDENFFLEQMFFGSLMAQIDPIDRAVYREPYEASRDSRRPLLAWPREIPFDGDPADVHAIVADNARWLQACDVPKLFVNAEPGNSIAGETREFCRRLANQTEITVRSNHYVTEDAGPRVAQALQAFVASVRAGAGEQAGGLTGTP